MINTRRYKVSAVFICVFVFMTFWPAYVWERPLQSCPQYCGISNCCPQITHISHTKLQGVSRWNRCGPPNHAKWCLATHRMRYGSNCAKTRSISAFPSTYCSQNIPIRVVSVPMTKSIDYRLCAMGKTSSSERLEYAIETF